MANQSFPPLFVAPTRPYYLLAPDYRRNSAGIRVMHMLCHLLNRCGQDAYMFPAQTNPLWHTPLLTGDLKQQHAEAGRRPIVVYPEVVRGNPANAQSVVRYLLNVPGLLGGDTEFASTDMIFAYAQNLLPEGESPDQLLFMPPIDTSIYNNLANPYDQQRKGWLLYPGRHVDALKEHPELAAKCTVITGEWPATPQEMAELFRRSERVYCFASTAIALEAILCGCPAVVLKSPFFDGVPLGIEEFGTHGLAFEDTPAAIEHAMAGIPIVREKYTALQNRFWEQLGTFIEKTQAMPSTTLGLDNPKVDGAESAEQQRIRERSLSIEHWLRQRFPTEGQAALMTRRLEERRHDLPHFNFIIVPDGQPATTETTRQSLQAQGYQFIDIHVAADAEVATLNDLAWQIVDGQWLCFVRAGTTFTPFGLFVLALELLDAPSVRAVYADEIVRTPTGELDTLLRPDFNLDMFLSCPANMARHWFYRRDVFLDAGGLDPECAGAVEFGLLLRLIEESDGLDGLAHISEPVCISAAADLVHNPQEQAVLERHLHRRGYLQARAQMHRPGIHRIHYGHSDTPLVSIVIAVRGRGDRVRSCVTSLMEQTTYRNYEILLVDNGNTDPATRAWLDGMAALEASGICVLRSPSEFDYGAVNNLAARHARGDYLVLLHSDTVIVQDDWLDALLNHAQRPEVGIVGAKLLHPDGTVACAGVVLGLNGPAHGAFAGQADSGGFMQRLEMDQNYSAVSGACLMIRRALYESLGGMDMPQLQEAYGDIDLCLKSGQAGYLTVWTPHAVVLQEGGAVQEQSAPSSQEAGTAEQDAMYRKWLPLIARDPSYNRNLSLQGAGFELETDSGLTWSPLAWRPLPVVLAMPSDLEGSGYGRIIDPALSMNISSVADVRLSLRDYLPAQLERLQPDAWVLQGQITDARIESLRRTAQFSSAFKVAEVDAYLPALPEGHVLRASVSGDIQAALQRFVGLADRLVVPTEALAEVLRGSNQDIRVLPDRLHPARWGALECRRTPGGRPRVGWVDELSDPDVQALMMDVVEALAGEVDWVCLGNCPEQMRPYVCELHDPVSFDQYPQKLASLHLDLALAPLGHGLFDACKSNVRLLQYAACGYPVVCSDVQPYQGLPVTRVKNIARDWQNAIRMHVADLDASARHGDVLRQAVLSQWMLDEQYVEQWLKAWLPD